MSLKDVLRARFASAINSIPPGTWKALVTDAYSQQLIDTVYTTNDILSMNVTSVDPLMSAREPMSVDGIYILTPTAQNVDRIIADFQGRRTYNSAHVYFIDGIDDRLAERLTGALGQTGVLKAFTELYCNFWALEDRVFGMKTPQAFYSFFGAPGGSVARDLAMEAFYDDLAVSGRTILNVLTTLGENPYIRYYQPIHHAPLGPLANQAPPPAPMAQAAPAAALQNANSLRWRSAMSGVPGIGGARSPEITGDYLSKKIAVEVQNELDAYMATNPDWPGHQDRSRAVLFIVDRGMDPVAPLLHEFWYQAMANDLLKIEDGQRYRYKFENTVGGREEREAILSEDDEVWVSVRHLHMKDAIDRLMTDFGRFVQENAGFRGNAQNVQVSDLKAMLANLPEFQQQREQFSLHLDMAQECMSLFETHHLNLVANVEQCAGTGFTSDGKTPKAIVEQMVPLLDDKTMSSLDKVRVIALYILYRDGVADEDRRRLYGHANLSITEQDMINNLVQLGVKVIKGDGKDRFRGTRIKQKYIQSDDEYELSRFKPVVQIMAEDHHANRLDQGQFPFVRDVPAELSNSLRSSVAPVQHQNSGTSLRSARPTWQKAPSARADNRNQHRQRYIIFVAGGVTHSEIRQAYVLSKQLGKEIFIGSTHIVTPESFLKDMKSLARGGIAGNPPNAPALHPQAPGRPNRNPGQSMAYQRIMDLRHWEPPVGPPSLAPPPQQPGQHPKSGGANKLSKNGTSGGQQQQQMMQQSGNVVNLKQFENMSLKDNHKGSFKGKFKMKWGSKD